MGSILGKQKTPVIPAATPVTPMPDAEDPAALLEKRRQAAAKATLSGRAATMLTDTSNKLGA